MNTTLYPYGETWKASVNRHGPEWIEYCEAVSLVKRYIRTRLQKGRQAAVDEFEATCELYRKDDTRSAEQVARLRALFKLIWQHERDALIAKVRTEMPPLAA